MRPPFVNAQTGWLMKNLGLMAANLANLFAPEKITLAGEVPSCCPLLRQTIEQCFRQYALGWFNSMPIRRVSNGYP